MNSIKNKIQMVKTKLTKNSDRNVEMISILPRTNEEVTKLSDDANDNLQFLTKHLYLIENKQLKWILMYALEKQMEIMDRHDEIHRETREQVMNLIKKQEEDINYILSKPEEEPNKK